MLKNLCWLNANISCLEDPGCWSGKTRKGASFDEADDDLCGCTFAITVGGCGGAAWLNSLC